MKRTLALLLILIMICLTACGGKEKKPTAEAEAETKPATPTEVFAKMEEQVAFPGAMLKLVDEDLLNTFGFEAGNFEEYVYAQCEDALLAETVVLVKVKDGTDTEAVKQKLDGYVTDQTLMFESYIPEQAVVAKKSVVGVKGGFVYMLMSSKVSELEKIVNDMVK